eukprot:TRINITY_DN880_c1_g3_i1.p1 TRINITY_DN880_c1_g3~~TRINITY_DN880_c1_g3_i1.p1  ORF type:complete len:1033 (+),score=216.79 TRINITY_DN880_c1_g3_i1:522-3620(+)
MVRITLRAVGKANGVLVRAPESMDGTRALLQKPPFSVPNADIDTTRFFLNNGEVFDFSWDLLEDGDVVDYGNPADDEPASTPRLVGKNSIASQKSSRALAAIVPEKQNESSSEDSLDEVDPVVSGTDGKPVRLIFVVGYEGVGRRSLIGTYRNDEDSTDVLQAPRNGHPLKSDVFQVDGVNVQLVAPHISHSISPDEIENLDSAHGVIVMYDLCKRALFTRVVSWWGTGSSKIPSVMVGNKLDDSHARQIVTKEGDKSASRFNMSNFEVSVRSGEGVENCLSYLLGKIDGRKKLGVRGKTLSFTEKMKGKLKRLTSDKKIEKDKTVAQASPSLEPSPTSPTEDSSSSPSTSSSSKSKIVESSDPPPPPPRPVTVAPDAPKRIKVERSRSSSGAGRNSTSSTLTGSRRRKKTRVIPTIDKRMSSKGTPRNPEEVREVISPRAVGIPYPKEETVERRTNLHVLSDYVVSTPGLPRKSLGSMDPFTAAQLSASKIDLSRFDRVTFYDMLKKSSVKDGLIDLFDQLPVPRYSIRYTNPHRGQYVLSTKLNPFTLSKNDLKNWSQIREQLAGSYSIGLSPEQYVVRGDLAPVVTETLFTAGVDTVFPTFIDHFLWMHESFISSYTLLRLLCIYYLAPPVRGEDSSSLQEQIVDVVCRWMTRLYDRLKLDEAWKGVFQDFRMHLKKASARKEEPHHRLNLDKLIAVWRALKMEYTEMMEEIQPAPLDVSDDEKPSSRSLSVASLRIKLSPATTLENFPPHALADQLTCLSTAIISRIPVFYYRQWADKRAETRYKCSRICFMVDIFEDLQWWVATSILMHVGTFKQRVAIVEYWCEVLERLHKNLDFHTAAAIRLGLGSHPVSLLKTVMSSMSKSARKKIADFDSVVDVHANHQSYNQHIARLVADATEDTPVIPIQTVLLHQLVKSGDLRTHHSSTNTINWDKVICTGSLLEFAFKSRVHRHKIRGDDQLQRFILSQYRGILHTELYATTILRDEKTGKNTHTPRSGVKKGESRKISSRKSKTPRRGLSASSPPPRK